MNHRIEHAIRAARAVAASSAAAECSKYNKGMHGTWTAEDEANLRAGFLRVWNPNRRQYEQMRIDPGEPSLAIQQARERLLVRCAEARARMGTR